VENGSIVGVLPAGQTQSASLSSPRPYRDFDLRFQASVEEGIGDCGVHFRSQLVDAEHDQVAGPLCTICGKDAPSGQLTGSLVTEPPTKVVRKAPAKLVERFVKPAVNYFHIRCQGNHILIEVNRIKTVNGDFPALPQEGVIAWTLSSARPAHKATFKILRFVDLTSAPEHPIAERPAVANTELLKAEVKFENAMKAADESLLKHFDLEIQKLQHHGHGVDPALVAAVEHEKEVFREKGLIPWSRPMRQPLLQYAKELAAARKTIGNAFDRAIERAEKNQNEKQKEALLDEAARVLAPRPVAIWESTDRGQTHRVFFSDATYVDDNQQDESIARFWTPPHDDKIVLEYPDPKNPSATMAWVFELMPYGNRMFALTKNGQKRFWQRVENE
jgi:hypothetical protein